MYLRSITVDGVRGLPDRTFSFQRQGQTARIVAITGPAASGKTTLLEAIVAAKQDVGSYGGAPDTQALVRPNLMAAKIALAWELSQSECERFSLTTAQLESETRVGMAVSGPPHEPVLQALLSRYYPYASEGKMEYFHAGRRLPLGGGVDLSKSAGDTMDKLSRLGADDTKYSGLLRYVVESGLGLHLDENGERQPPGRIGRAFEALCHSKRLAGLYQAGDSVLPGFVDAEGAAHGVAQLSDSERDALVFAVTFVRAGLVANVPGSIVLIDTPERNLSDAAAGGFVRALHGLGPNNQLIVATQSPAVVEAADVVIDLGRR